ncbi:Thp3 protein [Saccharomycopsis crataegensis]|uniref:Thp3 protein n=1 Tax=Saccharomycopsis crataegensis TaxID=43959 RepID=A0AAV5QEK2_9ASCO|nr:Thp3 protein [Saccharomycopsis crataegensis]
MSHYNEVQPTKLSGTKNVNNSSSSKKTIEKAAGGGYPEALKRFSLDCFNRCDILKFDAAKKNKVKEELKSLIEQAMKEGKVLTNNWRLQKLPSFDASFPLNLVSNMPEYTANEKEQEVVTNKPNKKRPHQHSKNDYDSETRKRMRSERFQKELAHKEPQQRAKIETPASADDRLVGTCQTLEKRYYRLTSEAVPEKVRPPEVLEKALEFVLNKFNTNSAVKYNYVCDQLKSIRQDLTVQLIEDDFTVKVYETHAKIAIDNDDLGEFNQCQTRLQVLYNKEGVEGKNKLEFLSYRILYFILTNNQSEIFKTKLFELLEEPRGFSEKKRIIGGSEKKKGRANLPNMKLEKEKVARVKMRMNNVFIDYALRIFDALVINNYVGFYRNYSKIVKLNKSRTYNQAFDTFIKLMANILEKCRIRTLYTMSGVYRSLNLPAIEKQLKFDSPDQLDEYMVKKGLNHLVKTGRTSKGEVKILDFTNSQTKNRILAIYKKSYKVDIKGQI